MKYLNWLIKSILAGIFIGIGCIAYLSSNSKIIGSLFFTIGLFIILTFKLNLFTGKLCYVIEKKNFDELGITLIGNYIGTLIIALFMRLSRLSNLLEQANTVVDIKMNDSIISLFILSILCNILIYIAVEGFNRENNVEKILSLFFGVTIFVLAGFEHCIADMVYFNFTLTYSWSMLLRLFIIIYGNIAGGISIRYLMTRRNK